MGPLGDEVAAQIRAQDCSGGPQRPPHHGERRAEERGLEQESGGGSQEGERWGNKGYIGGAGGEQMVHIITLSSGMERGKLLGVKER